MADEAAVSPIPTVPMGGFHRKPLPGPSVAFSSAAGKQLTKEAMAAGGMEIFFRLAETFHTQNEPAFCGLGTLVMVLNALEVDPGEVWKGAWRWYDEMMLDCCVELDQVKEEGVTWDVWCCLGRCQGLQVDAIRAEDSSLEAFRKVVATTCTRDDGYGVCVVSYSRRVLGQTGDGHYSPVGGYHAASDSVLVLDVARFKHPPHWIPTEELWRALLAHDKVTGRSRGYAILSRRAAASPCDCTEHEIIPPPPPPSPKTSAPCHEKNPLAQFSLAANAASRRSCIQVTFGRNRLGSARAFFSDPSHPAANTAAEEVWQLLRSLPPQAASLLNLRSSVDSDGETLRDTLAALECTEVYRLVSTADAQFRSHDGPLPLTLGSAAALLLVAPALVGDYDDEGAVRSLLRRLPLSAPAILAFLSAGPAAKVGGVTGGEDGEQAEATEKNLHGSRGELFLRADIHGTRLMLREMALAGGADCSKDFCPGQPGM